MEWGPSRTNRIRELKAQAYGLHDLPVALRRPLKKHLSNSEESRAKWDNVARFRPLTPAFSLFVGKLGLQLECFPPTLMMFLGVESGAFPLRFGNIRISDLLN